MFNIRYKNNTQLKVFSIARYAHCKIRGTGWRFNKRGVKILEFMLAEHDHRNCTFKKKNIELRSSINESF